jgi:hypothetical protein
LGAAEVAPDWELEEEEEEGKRLKVSTGYIGRKRNYFKKEIKKKKKKTHELTQLLETNKKQKERAERENRRIGIDKKCVVQHTDTHKRIG